MELEIKAFKDGKEVPLSEVSVETFEKMREPKPEPEYQFQGGDVARCKFNDIRIIVNVPDKGIMSVSSDGNCASTNQKDFEYYKYKKIGILSDFIK